MATLALNLDKSVFPSGFDSGRVSSLFVSSFTSFTSFMSSFCYPLIVKAFLFSFEVIVLSLLKVKTNLAFQKSEGVSENPDSGI